MFIIMLVLACNEKPSASVKIKPDRKHHLHIPAIGIQSMMEENSRKTLEGTDGEIIVSVGEVTRKKADVAIQRNDKIIDERIVEEGNTMQFDYDGTSYTIEVKNIKKPLLGAGKVELHIQ
mgnify:CR=1 FL=1